MKFIIGNWKMNGNTEEKETMLRALKNVHTKNQVILCLPFTLLCGNDYGITIGAQDVSQFSDGAHTGDISGAMLKDSGVKYVLVGHSERRSLHHETNEIVKAKATAAIKNGLIPIVCIGETESEKQSGRTMSVVKKMLMESVPEKGDYIVAYEPRWAIGSGKQPTDEEIINVHQTITKALHNIHHDKTPILYGGSVNPLNAQQIASLANVDGLLIGGASLKSDTFLPIIKSIN